MAKVKSTRKYNKPLKVGKNYFNLGGNIFQNTFSDMKNMIGSPSTAFQSPTMGASSMMGATASAVGLLGGNLLSNGLDSKAGNAIRSVGNSVSGIPVIGGFASGALNLVGGAVNGLFGMKVNLEEVNRVNKGVADLNSAALAASNATSFDDDALSSPSAMNFGVNAYKGGVFSGGKAKKKNMELAQQLKAANSFAVRSADNTILNISENLLNDVQANYTAFGGNLNTHGANFDTGITFILNGGSHESNPYEGVPMGVDQEGTPNLVEEGEVIYNDYVFSKRLKVPQAVRTKYKLRGDKSLTYADAALLMSKESEERPNDPISLNGLDALLGELANSQEMSRKTKLRSKYAFGGNLFSGEEEHTSSLVNPYPGGSKAINNADVFSNWDNFRYGNTLLYDPATRRYNSMYSSEDFMNWANTDPAAIAFQKEYWGNKDNAKNYYASNKSAPTYEDLFIGTKGRKALMYDAPFGNSLAYSDAHKYGRDLFEMYMNRNNKGSRNKGERRFLTGKTDANGTPLDPIDITDLYDGKTSKYLFVRKGSSFDKDTDYTDYYYTERATPAKLKPRFRDSADGEFTVYDSLDAAQEAGIDLSKYGKPTDGDEFSSYTKLKDSLLMPNFDNWMRYMPIAGSLTGLGLSVFSKPDESAANAVLEAAKGAGQYQPVKFKPVGNYLTYNPFDVEYAANQANATAGATRRNIMNTAGGNRGTAMAGILAADNNALNQLGILRRGAAEDNLKQRQLVEDFNRSTNEFNSEGFFKADAANQSARANAASAYLNGTIQAEDLRQRAKLARDNSIATNMSNLFTSLGNIGSENVARKLQKWLLDLGYAPGWTGTKKAKGGKIKRVKKGLTY